jgi:hypothetical protein
MGAEANDDDGVGEFDSVLGCGRARGRACALAGGSVGGIGRGLATDTFAVGDELDVLEVVVDGAVDTAGGGAKGERGDEGERSLTGISPVDDPFPSLLIDAVLSGRDGSLGLELGCS